METPSSSRRMTRSQTKAALSNTTNISSRMIDDSAKSRQRNQERSVLIDITNDSPIVGLASGNLSKTPVSSMAKQKSSRCKRTPGSGEALLRGQVKNLLQKVEEEAEISKFLSFESDCNRGVSNGHHGLKGLFNTPDGHLPPTPVNTPQVFNCNSSLVDEFESLTSVLESPIEDNLTVTKVLSGIYDGKQQPESESETEKVLISRSLFQDFSDKSDSFSDCSSVMAYQATEKIEKSSQTSLLLTSSSSKEVESSEKGSNIKSPVKDDDDEDEDEEDVIQDDYEQDYSCEDDRETKSDLFNVDELCEGIRNISVNGEKEAATFMGKHVRFEYNSDDELDATEILHLKGLPTPQGKHRRFQDDKDDE